MNGNMGAPGDGVRMSGDRVAGVAAEVTGRAVAGEGSWAAVPGFRPVAAGAAFLDRGARLEAAVEAMLVEHRAGTADHSRRLWTVLCLMIWHGIFVEGRIDPQIPEPDYPVNI